MSNKDNTDQQRTLVTLPTPETMRMRYAKGQSSDLIICFAGIGGSRTKMPADEFVGSVLSNTTAHCLFVSDRKRSWLNDPTLCLELQKIVQNIQKDCRIKRTTALGLSMGGFSALVCATLFPVTTALAISPQYSMSKAILPHEHRWEFWRERLGDLRFETADSVQTHPQQSFIVHAGKNDAAHLRLFAPRRNRAHFVFPSLSHSEIGLKLKEDGVLSQIIHNAMEGDRRAIARTLQKSGAVWRSRFDAGAV